MSPAAQFLAALVIAGASITGLPGCAGDRPEQIQHEEMKTRRPITQVLNDNSSRLMKIESVVGVYEGVMDNGDPCIGVMAKDDRPGLREDVPDSVEGYSVRLEITGEIRPLR